VHDLETINRLNAEAFAASIDNYRRQGRYVLAVYAGLTLVSIETFTAQEEAFRAFDLYRDRNDSMHGRLFFPTGDATGAAIFPPIVPEESEQPVRI
jgi:hypothetical protein